ncbi:hypothetical protein C4544_05665 [candidate division WS5 bacterium]|uniref:Uncharacterized protein n=1 Tax=candidate division WS5 bacterium TaxID=2093353 RepID=A0A419DAW4_9BACT|nr:MAG: hypothetical protein C4544_05665 [candidate division WS5 bacterium]
MQGGSHSFIIGFLRKQEGSTLKKQFGDFCHVRLSATTKISRCLTFVLGRVPGNKTKIFKIRLSPFGMAEATRLFLDETRGFKTIQRAVFAYCKNCSLY